MDVNKESTEVEVVVHIEMGIVVALIEEDYWGYCKQYRRGCAELCSVTESIGVAAACVERYKVGMGKEREDDGFYRTA